MSDSVTVKVELWVMVAESGKYVFAADLDELEDRYANDVVNCLDFNNGTGRQAYKLALAVPLPVPQHIKLTAEVPVASPRGDVALKVRGG